MQCCIQLISLNIIERLLGQWNSLKHYSLTFHKIIQVAYRQIMQLVACHLHCISQREVTQLATCYLAVRMLETFSQPHVTDLYQSKKCLIKLASTVFLVKSIFVFAILSMLLLSLFLVRSLIFFFYLHLLHLLRTSNNFNNGHKRQSTKKSMITQSQPVPIPLVR